MVHHTNSLALQYQPYLDSLFKRNNHHTQKYSPDKTDLVKCHQICLVPSASPSIIDTHYRQFCMQFCSVSFTSYVRWPSFNFHTFHVQDKNCELCRALIEDRFRELYLTFSSHKFDISLGNEHPYFSTGVTSLFSAARRYPYFKYGCFY